jgi:hypothetical protein
MRKGVHKCWSIKSNMSIRLITCNVKAFSLCLQPEEVERCGSALFHTTTLDYRTETEQYICFGARAPIGPGRPYSRSF